MSLGTLLFDTEVQFTKDDILEDEVCKPFRQAKKSNWSMPMNSLIS